MSKEQKDNSTAKQKIAIRRMLLARLEEPAVIMETHGGVGHIYRNCYTDVATDGIVFEKNPSKCAVLAKQGPSWAVYEADVLEALKAGAGAHLLVNFLDLDPYGEPWPVLDAFFGSERPRSEKLFLVVNDGLRQRVRIGGAWSVGSLAEIVQTYGNDIHDQYLEVCKELLIKKAALADYSLDRFTGYYCGFLSQMTHYAAMLTLSGGSK